MSGFTGQGRNDGGQARESVELAGPGGGLARILGRGSRVISLAAPGGGPQAFWTNPDAASGTDDWNVGGDRTWIGPELDYFLNEDGDYVVPPALDPGSYRLSAADRDAGHAETEMTSALTHSGTRSEVAFKLRKRYSAIPSPFLTNDGAADEPALRELSFAGYECRISLQGISLSGHCCTVWNLMQVPHGGTVLVPTIGKPRAMTMFGAPGASLAFEHPHHLQLSYAAGERFKLSIDAVQSVGRFGYLRRLDGGTSTLLVRQFHVLPAGSYPDYPAGQPGYAGSCMQFYCDDGALGTFGELEYHSPALSAEGEDGALTDLSQVYYFVGPDEAIDLAVERLLGITPDQATMRRIIDA